MPRSLVYAGIAALLVAGVIDDMRQMRRRAARRLGESWARLERKEGRQARQAEIALLAGRLVSHPPRARSG
jgi:hypothetical protein